MAGRDEDFELKLAKKPVSVYCYCDKTSIISADMVDCWDCICDMLYKEGKEEVETRFFLNHVGFMKRKKK